MFTFNDPRLQPLQDAIRGIVASGCQNFQCGFVFDGKLCGVSVTPDGTESTHPAPASQPADATDPDAAEPGQPEQYRFSDDQIGCLLSWSTSQEEVLSACLSHDYGTEIGCHLVRNTSGIHVRVTIPAHLADKAKSIADRVISLTYQDEEEGPQHFFDACWIDINSFTHVRRFKR